MDYHDGVVCLPEPDIVECEVKWALRRIAVNKANGCNEIPAELFRSLKDDAIKAAFIMSANLEDPAVATGLDKVNPYPKSPRRVVPKKVLSIGQLYLSPC